MLISSNYSDIVSRNGGEEFSILMKNFPQDEVLKTAERIRRTVQEHEFLLIDGQAINITVSIGVSIYPDTVNDINMIFGEILEKYWYPLKNKKEKATKPSLN